MRYFQSHLSVFVPYRGFYFLNYDHSIFVSYDIDKKFSSPIGAFIFLMELNNLLLDFIPEFSSPIGAFIFLIYNKIKKVYDKMKSFRPLSGLLFS